MWESPALPPRALQKKKNNKTKTLNIVPGAVYIICDTSVVSYTPRNILLEAMFFGFYWGAMALASIKEKVKKSYEKLYQNLN